MTSIVYYESATNSARLANSSSNRDLGVVDFSELSRRAWLANWTLVVNGHVVFRPTLRKSACSVIRAVRPKD